MMRSFGTNKKAAAMAAEEARPAGISEAAAPAEEPRPTGADPHLTGGVGGMNPAEQDMDSYIKQRVEEVDAQAAEFQKKNPGFDMRREIQNPDFCRYVWGNGLTVEEAFYLAHRNETADRAEENAQKPAAAARRIDENGAGKNRPAMTKKNPQDMSDDEIDHIIARVRRGEKIKF